MYRPYGRDPVGWQEYFVDFEELMNSLDGRPHWAKIHRWTPVECRASWPMFGAFSTLRQKLDPDRLFWNDYLDRVFGDSSEASAPSVL